VILLNKPISLSESIWGLCIDSPLLSVSFGDQNGFEGEGDLLLGEVGF